MAQVGLIQPLRVRSLSVGPDAQEPPLGVDSPAQTQALESQREVMVDGDWVIGLAFPSLQPHDCMDLSLLHTTPSQEGVHPG